ncbi:peptide ABC transporter substrate-binding protein [Bacillus sp. 31A1R]|uniref:Peptide ABC transporter substrate-binding protein n=1 Tax=Robertmurraya mangrovi TaxID=3098077 RepID=A0ABU5IT63_9BACI|nr:peptide ABC transporter substrate-binding protein [Bacillus sp. 31A1R]MDZ5470347.1 peptide ABC transporter substrate-binding protein [Bacillus sp. 31A1R]
MKKSKFSLLLVLSLVLSMFLAACSGGQKEEDTGTGTDKGTDAAGELADKQEITVLESAEIPSLDPSLVEDAVGITILNNINEGLYRIDQNQEPVPALADGEPEVSEDGLVYKIKLRDAQWSNGDKITAQDFVYSWQRAINPETGSSYGPYMMMGKIKNATEIYEGKAELSDLGIKALSDNELEITLVKPKTYFKSLMAFPTFFPLNQKFVEEKGDKFASSSENLLYTGPFSLADWTGTEDVEWTLLKNDTYWDKDTVTLTKINYNVLKDAVAAANAIDAGEADISTKLSLPEVISLYEGDPRLVRWLEPTIFWLKFNQETEALKNVNIRKALSMAFDKDALVNDVLQNGSLAANYAVPTEFVKHPDTDEDFRAKYGDFNKFNPEEAKKFWETGLKEIGKDSLEFTYVSGDSESAKKIDAFMKNQLETNLPGLKVNIKSVPFATRLELEDKQEYDLLHSGWGPDYHDAISFSNLWLTGGGNNKMSYSNKEYDALIEAAEGDLANDPGKRFEAFQDAEKILFEDAAIAPIFQRAANKLVNEKVEGFTYHLNGPDYSFKWTKLQK